MRLGFAVAVAIRPTILIVDEIIAVGDEEFQRKCFDYMRELRHSGTTIALVTHSLSLAQEMCDEVVWLDHGKVKQVGPADDVVSAYLRAVNEKEAAKRAADTAAEAARAAEETLAKVAEQAKAAEESIARRLAEADAAAEAAAARAAESREEAQKTRTDAVAEAEGIRLSANRESEEKLAVARRRAMEVTEELEEKLAWRKEELARDVADLEAKREQALAKLGNLRALAEESEARFADEPTTVIPQVEPRR